MARQTGPLFFTGRIGDLSFYKSGKDYLVRRCGGPSRKAIMSSPRFVRTRENLSEFGRCSATGAALRRALGALAPMPDRRLYQRLTQQLCRVKACDVVSERGERSVSEGLKTREGRALLRGFAFNSERPLHGVLPGGTSLCPDGAIDIHLKGLRFPKGATVLVVRALCLQPQSNQPGYAAYRYAEVEVAAGEALPRVRLQPETAAAALGDSLHFVQLSFYAQGRAGLQRLAGGAQDALGYVPLEPEPAALKPETATCKRIRRLKTPAYRPPGIAPARDVKENQSERYKTFKRKPPSVLKTISEGVNCIGNGRGSTGRQKKPDPMLNPAGFGSSP